MTLPLRLGLTRGIHEVNLTVFAYTPDNHQIVESIKRTVIVGKLCVQLSCPTDIAVTDPAGRTISQQASAIPNATYSEADPDGDGDFEKFIEILDPIDGNYVFTLNGTGAGLYGMIAQSITSQGVVSFSATQIPSSLGSVDKYTVNWTALSQGGQGVAVGVDSNGDGVFEYNFTSGSMLTRVEYVAATTKYDLGITGITPSKTVTGEGYTLLINVTIMNYGVYTETFNITIYANTTLLTSQTITLANATSTTITYAWNTTGFAKGNYTINAVIDTLPSETYTIDNTLAYRGVFVSIIGDINGDKKVELKDVYAVAKAYGSVPGHPRWNPLCDINNDGEVELKDYYLTCKNYGKTWS
jgi:hypothetical protein